MLRSVRPRRWRGTTRRELAHRHPHRLLRSPSFLVTSVAAIGGLSAIGAGPASDLANDGTAVGARVASPEVSAEEVLLAEAGAAAMTPFIVLDPVTPADAVQPVTSDALTLLGSVEEFSDLGAEADAAAVGFDALDPAEFAAFDTDPAPQEDETGEDETAEDAPLVYEGADGELIDPERLRTWLAGRNYPLADYSQELVAAGIDHGVDPRLIVGIAVIESSGGKRLPPSTHNAWGWSGNGPHGLRSWSSWPEAIDGFTEGLARVYDTDNVDERMARKYVPPNWEKWLRTVRWVINDI
jgi:hypothetical protein